MLEKKERKSNRRKISAYIKKYLIEKFDFANVYEFSIN